MFFSLKKRDNELNAWKISKTQQPRPNTVKDPLLLRNDGVQFYFKVVEYYLTLNMEDLTQGLCMNKRQRVHVCMYIHVQPLSISK